MPDADSQPSTFEERDDWIRAVLASDLSHVAARVAVRIGLHLNVEFGRCDPGVGKIATGSKVSERSVYRQLALLEQAGWIEIRSGGGRKRSNHYVLKYPDKVLSGFNSENPVSGDRKTLSAVAQNTATKVADKKSLKAKRTVAGATTPATGERERELALAVIPGALAPDGGAPKGLKDRFAVLLAIWKRPWGKEDEAAAWEAFVEECRAGADADEIIASARRWVAARKTPTAGEVARQRRVEKSTAAKADARPARALVGRKNCCQIRRSVVTKPPPKSGDIVPVKQQLPATVATNPFRAFDQFTKDADYIVRRFDQIEDLLRSVRDKADDRLFAEAKRKAALHEHDQQTLERCEVALQTFDGEENYEDEEKEVLRPGVIALRIAGMLDSNPYAKPRNPEAYITMLVERVIGIEGLTLPALQAACIEISDEKEFLPSLATLMKALLKQQALWHDRTCAIVDLADTSARVVAAIEAMELKSKQAAKARAVKQARSDLNLAQELQTQAFDQACDAQEAAATAAQEVAQALDKLAQWDATVSDAAQALAEAVKCSEQTDDDGQGP
jgi:hypothetical protein